VGGGGAAAAFKRQKSKKGRQAERLERRKSHPFHRALVVVVLLVSLHLQRNCNKHTDTEEAATDRSASVGKTLRRRRRRRRRHQRLQQRLRKRFLAIVASQRYRNAKKAMEKETF